MNDLSEELNKHVINKFPRKKNNINSIKNDIENYYKVKDIIIFLILKRLIYQKM